MVEPLVHVGGLPYAYFSAALALGGRVSGEGQAS